MTRLRLSLERITVWVVLPAVMWAGIIAGGCIGRWIGRKRPPLADAGMPPITSEALPPAPTPGVVVPSFAVLGWLGGLCIMAGVAGLAASFVVPIIPRKAAASTLGMGLGLLVLQNVMQRYLTAMTWLLGVGIAVAAVAVAWPLIGTAQRWALDRLGKRIGAEHPDAAVALKAAARGWTKPKHKTKRKQLAGA